MYGYIYITTNILNNRKYIGKHKSIVFDPNYHGSGKAIKNAINKYGVENFVTEILECCETLKELNEKEIYYISLNDAVNSKEFYNLKDGGEGGGVKNQVYITNGHINKKVYPHEVEKYLSMGFRLGGPRQSDETKQKRAKSNRGKKHPTAGAKISASLTGKRLSEEHKQKLREAKLGKPSPRSLKVRCIETGAIYDSLRDASLANGSKHSGNLCSCLKGDRSTAFGCHWEYVPD